MTQREECKQEWCDGLDRLREDFREHRQELKQDYSRHQTFIGALVAVGIALFGAMTQWQIAKLNHAPAQALPYISASK